MSARIPVIDVSGFDAGGGERQNIARAWDAAFRTAGFCSLVGYGTTTLVDEAYHAARAYFSLPLARRSACPGYLAYGAEAVGRASGRHAEPDLVEAIQFDDLHRPPVQAAKWPPDLMPFWDLAHRYAVAMGTLSRLLMRISAIALDLNENYFDDVYAGMTTKLRFAIYPDQVEPPAPGQYRNAPHTDFNGFTILRQDDAPGGLQVQLADGEWLDVLPVAGSLVINAGDLIQRWTNDRWRSNVHRVINPPRALTGSAQRLSIVLFTGPDPRAEIACLPGCAPAGSAGTYPPIIAGDHVREKVRLTLGTL
jgi:isopenicillin N synthase-like dioxygenase